MSDHKSHEDRAGVDRHPGDAAMERQLDALAQDDAARAAEGFEDRIMSGVAGVWAPAPIAIGSRRNAWWQRTGVRAAAGLALVGAVGAAMLLRHPTAGDRATSQTVNVALVEERIDGLVALANADDLFGDSLASIELWADALDSDIGSDWVGSDLVDLSVNGGSL